MSRKVPVFLEPSKDRKIVVFGGGNVAYRKCRQFEGFHITVIADRTIPDMDKVCDEIILDHFDPRGIDHYLEGKFIAIAATDNKDLNGCITESAKKHGVLINSAHGGGNILLPSAVKKKNYTIAVSSEGTVPAFPPYVAKKIDSYLGDEYDLMMELLIDRRKGLQDRVRSQPKRAEYLAEVLETESIWNYLKTGDPEEARRVAESLEIKYRDQ